MVVPLRRFVVFVFDAALENIQQIILTDLSEVTGTTVMGTLLTVMVMMMAVAVAVTVAVMAVVMEND